MRHVSVRGDSLKWGRRMCAHVCMQAKNWVCWSIMHSFSNFTCEMVYCICVSVLWKTWTCLCWSVCAPLSADCPALAHPYSTPDMEHENTASDMLGAHTHIHYVHMVTSGAAFTQILSSQVSSKPIRQPDPESSSRSGLQSINLEHKRPDSPTDCTQTLLHCI